MTRYETTFWYRVYAGVVPAVAVAGGVGMVAGGLIGRGDGLVPLLVIGAWWTAVGSLGLGHWQRSSSTVEAGEHDLVFIGRRLRVTVPIADVLEIRPLRFDLSRLSPLRVRTRHHGVVRMSPRLHDQFDLLWHIRQANPDVVIRVPS